MQTQAHVNTFSKGMVQDVDRLQLGKESYLYSLGGRVIFNEDGTYAWENSKGTKFAFNLDANYGQDTDYSPIGGWQIGGKLVLFSTDGTNSEIGLVYEETYGVYSYQSIFNDLYDPYGNFLGFSLAHQMRDCQVVVENNKTENIYFNDDFNEPRVFNVILGLQSVSPEFTSGDYLPIGGATVGNVYPSFYSVHGMASMMDLTWGKLKYTKNIAGSLLSGEYQYAYRYIHQTGYVSGWSPLTSFVLLTTDAVQSDWTKYQMQDSGEQTDKGIQLELKYIDQRFQQIEVAALYWKTGSVPDSAYTFFKGSISGSSMVITHQFTGETITVDSLVQRYTEIKQAKTGGLKDNTYHLANLVEFQNLEIDVTDITAEPVTRPMLSDQYTNEVANVFAPPFTNQKVFNTSLTENLADGLPEVYSIYNDYINYKGTQWRFLFQGLWGGQEYPFAIVIFDRKGQPCFAQHITDFTTPQRYSNEWSDKRLVNGTEVITTGTTGSVGDWKHTSNTNGTVICDDPNGTNQVYNYTYDLSGDSWFLNLIGMKFGNIYFPDSVLYDSAGNLQVSGFSIVRADRIKTILAQGLVMSAGASAEYSPKNTQNNQQLQFSECPTMFNGYIETGGGAYSPYQIGFNGQYVGMAPNSYDPTFLPHVQNLAPGVTNPLYTARPNMAFFCSPDYMIDNTLLPDSISGDTIKTVNVCVKAYGTAGYGGQVPYDLQYEGYYIKNYRSVVDQSLILSGYNSNTSYYDNVLIGDEINIDTWYNNIQSGTKVFGSQEYVTTVPIMNYLSNNDNRWLSRKIQPTCFFTFGTKVGSFSAVPLLGVLTDDGFGNVGAGTNSYFIANYVRPAGSYSLTESLLQSRIYNNTGHFVPINQDIIDTVKALDPNGHCVFNDVKVWGGDCFLDFFTYYRLYADLDQVGSPKSNQDYNIGLSFPIESSYNIALRQGNTYERFGGTPADTYNSGGTLFSDGLYYFDSEANKIEDFNVNKVLQAEDTIDLYYPKPSSFNEVYDFPVREQYTGTKIYGEKYDSFRKFPVNNFRDADGSKGEINSLQNIFNYLYIIQRSGFARVRFNDREMITGSTGSSLDIGSAIGLAGFDYISNIYGSQHEFSVVNTGRMLHWVDAERGKHIRFAADGLLTPSDAYGEHNFFTQTSRYYWGKDNPLSDGGIVGVFDFENQSVYFTFTELDSKSAQTIEYSELTNQYKSFHSFTPKIYYNFKEGFYSPNPTNPYKTYSHESGIRGNIYDVYVNSKIRFVVNPEVVVGKWFDNGSMAINNELASTKLYSVEAYTENNSPQIITFPTDTRWKYLQGLVRYPLRGVNADSRLRGKSCVVEITIANDSDDIPVRISNHNTDFRISPKI